MAFAPFCEGKITSSLKYKSLYYLAGISLICRLEYLWYQQLKVMAHGKGKRNWWEGNVKECEPAVMYSRYT